MKRCPGWGMRLACLLLTCGAFAALAPIRAYAQFTGKASALGQFESNSNVFALESGISQPGVDESRRSDSYLAYGAEFDGNYSWGRQDIYATAQTKDYEYQHFTELNHDDYKLDAGLIWRLAEPLDGKLDVTRTHAMVPFLDLTGLQALSVETDQRETLHVDLKLNSSWKVEGTAYSSKTDQPIPDAPDLQLKQNSGTASLEYTGVGWLTSGFTAGYLSGGYNGSNGTMNPSFSQTVAGFLANYKLNRTTFEGQVGYSHRMSATGSDNTSGFTGLFDFKDQLTAKTSFAIKIDRMINSYLLNSSSEIDTEAGATVVWQATYKLAASLGYTFTYRDYPGQGNYPVGSDRIDRQQFATVELNYQFQRWLLIKPYANLQTRRSNFIGGDFNSTIFGVSVTVTTPDSVRKR